jgi:hypothetical protein
MRGLLILLILSCGHFAIAQHGFQDGFLLTHSLDTVHGLVRFSGKADVPTPCLFKPNKKAAPKEIYPGTVHGFCTSKGAYFYTRSIGKSDDVFLEALVKGHVSLFRFGEIYFIEKADSAFFELSDELEVVMVEGQRQEQKSRNYTRMLSLLMNDCPEASKKAPTVPLKEKHLVGLVQVYNRCRGAESELFRVKVKK